MLIIRVYSLFNRLQVTVCSTVTSQIIDGRIMNPALYADSYEVTSDDPVEAIASVVRKALAESNEYAGDLGDHL